MLNWVFEFSDFLTLNGEEGGMTFFKPQQEIHVMAAIAFKYSYFCVSIGPACDNVLGKNLKVPFLQ